MPVTTAVLALAVAGLAQAQGVDGHGPIAPLYDASPRAPLTVLAPWSRPAGAWSAVGVLEGADEPVVQYVQTAPDDITPVSLLDDVFALDLSGSWGLANRIGLAGTLPVFLGSSGTVGGGGPTLGDMQVWLPIAVVLPDGSRGFGFSAVPWVALPTGAQARFLGDSGPGIGATLAAGLGLGAVSFDANLGVGVAAGTELPSQRVGGSEAVGGLAIGLHPWESWSLHFETRFTSAFNQANQVVGTPGGIGDNAASPAEALLTFKTHLPGKAWGTAGVGRAVSSGIGAARVRGYLGVGLAHDPKAEETRPEAVGSYAIRVLDPAGVPVPGAELVVGGRAAGVAEGDGVVRVPDIKWQKGVQLRGPFHEVIAVAARDDGSRAFDVTLPWVPFELPVRVQDQAGKAVQGRIAANPADGGPAIEAVDGALQLLPGEYQVEVTAPGFGTQSRAVVVDGSGRPPSEIDVVLLAEAGPAALAVTLTDPEGAPVDGARVLLDGQPLGTTGGGGTLRIEGLAPGPHALTVLHDDFTALEEPELKLAQGETTLPLVLRRVPGSVKVVARGPTGRPVPDAVVRFDGPRRLAPTPLGPRGERIQTLGPGTWTLILTSAEHGVQQREIVVPDDSWELITVEVVLQPGEQGQATLAVRVIDPDGFPIDGARVLLDGKDLGATSTGGALKLVGLAAGPRTLQLTGDEFRPEEPRDLFLVEGLQEEVLTLDWLAGSVLVTARSNEGAVGDAVIRWVGGERMAPAPLGSTGESLFHLPDGDWTALATSEQWGLKQADVTVPPDSRSLQRVDLLMAPDEGGLADLVLRVVDPDGTAVIGADVSIDGVPVGTTTNTGTLTLKHLSVGKRTIGVEAARYAASESSLRLLEGSQDTELTLDWAPGAARVRVVSGGAPVPDAVVRMIGPEPVAPAPVDGLGLREFLLVPGTSWQVVAVSAQAGVGQAALEIPEAADGLVELEVDIAAPTAGAASLLVRVVDEDGAPIAGAAVTVDGDAAGVTGAGGVLLAEGLAPGSVRIDATHAGYTALPSPARARLAEGTQERILVLGWRPRTLSVVVQDGDGAPVDARVQLVGPVDVAPFATGADGVEAVSLRPGTWTVVASTDALGPSRAEVVVQPGADPAPVALVLRPSRVAMTGEAVVIKEQVQFDFGKASLRGESGAVLDEVANAILGNPRIIEVEIQGHSDAIGDVAYNQALSQKRAEAVRAALIARGVPPETLTARGYGTQRPIADNETEDGRARNRRVEFEIAEQASE